MNVKFDPVVLKEARSRSRFSQGDMAQAIGISLRQYQRIETGDPTRNEHAVTIAELLNTTVVKLGVRPAPPRNLGSKEAPRSLENTLSKIGATMQEWLENGDADHPEFETDDGVKLPLHVGYVYRLTGEWKSWNKACGVDPDKNPAAYAENLYHDAIEDCAWRLIQFMQDLTEHVEKYQELEEEDR